MPPATKKKTALYLDSTQHITTIALRACLVAKDAAFNVRDFMQGGSKMALLAVRDCEKELDRIERQIDDELPKAITEVSEEEARQLLACFRFTIDLERIGDLTWTVAHRLEQLTARLPREDARDLVKMSVVLEKMLAQVHAGFLHRDLELAESVLQLDADVDAACHAVFQRHLESTAQRVGTDSTSILLMAQAFERAGDHTKNLAEELFHLVRGHSQLHASKQRKRIE
jgi:phosphate transport system protein